MKIQSLPQNANAVKFSGIKKHTNKSERLTERKTASSDVLKSLTLLGAALLATINLSACSPAQTQNTAQSETPAVVEIEETEEENTKTDIEDKSDENDIKEGHNKPEPKPSASTKPSAPNPVLQPPSLDSVDTSISNNDSSPKTIPLTADTIAKSEEAKEYILEAIDTYNFINSEIWDNFPAMYNATKNLDGITISYNQSDDGTILKDHGTEGDFKAYYNEYGTIAKIAAGEIEPWKGLTTGEEAANLINKLLLEAIGGGNDSYVPYAHEHSVIDGREFINKGELDIIYLVLNELSTINPDTQHVATIFRTELDKKLEESTKWRNQNSLESNLKNNSYKTSLADNLKIIKIQAKDIKKAKEAYEAAKADFVNGNYTPDNKDEKLYNLQQKLNDLYAVCNWQINCAGLNSWNIDANIRISFSDTKEAMESATATASKFLEIPLKINFPVKDTPDNDKSDSKLYNPNPGDEIMNKDSELTPNGTKYN